MWLNRFDLSVVGWIWSGLDWFTLYADIPIEPSCWRALDLLNYSRRATGTAKPTYTAGIFSQPRTENIHTVNTNMLTSIKTTKTQPTGYRYCKTHVHCRYILTTQNREYTHRNHQHVLNHKLPSLKWLGYEGNPCPNFQKFLEHRKNTARNIKTKVSTPYHWYIKNVKVRLLTSKHF